MFSTPQLSIYTLALILLAISLLIFPIFEVVILFQSQKQCTALSDSLWLSVSIKKQMLIGLVLTFMLYVVMVQNLIYYYRVKPSLKKEVPLERQFYGNQGGILVRIPVLLGLLVAKIFWFCVGIYLAYFHTEFRQKCYKSDISTIVLYHILSAIAIALFLFTFYTLSSYALRQSWSEQHRVMKKYWQNLNQWSAVRTGIKEKDCKLCGLGETNLRLNCQHQVHSDCLGKACCGYCKSEDIFPIHKFCKSCCLSSLVYKEEDFKFINKDFQCDSCEKFNIYFWERKRELQQKL